MKILKDKVILAVLMISVTYWIYLLNASQMTLGGDAAGYEQLGRILSNLGWVNYFQTGPNREPIYPALIALAMKLAPFFGCEYQKMLTFFQINCLLVTQIILILFLEFLNIHRRIIAILALYLAFSPALINAGFSLYSEIAAIPVSLGALYLLVRISDRILKQKPARGLSVALGVLFGLSVLIKAAFEVIVPLVLIVVLIFGILVYRHHIKIVKHIVFTVLIVGGLFLGIVNGYKMLNFSFNGNYVVTDRASWALYGNTMRRMEPITGESIKAAVLYMAGEGVCKRFSSQEECYRWSFSHSDDIGMPTYSRLMREGLTVKEADRKVITLAVQEVLKNPLQYGFFFCVEGMKMFFWESTQIGFVQYPSWLAKIYDSSVMSDGIRLAMFLITLIGVFYCLFHLFRLKAQTLVGITLASIYLSVYIGVYAFFYILTRYALPIAPIFLVFIAVALHLRINHVKEN